jgi:transcriptional regulator of acetoin/glycerol metabolism
LTISPQAALLAQRWNAKRAAKSLGISRATFYRWLGTGDSGDGRNSS